jgi:nitrogen regulatory protein P-II 1
VKKVSAIIHSYKLDAVKLALLSVGVIGITIYEIKSFGSSKGSTTRYRGNELKNDFVSKINIETVIEDELVEIVVQEISLAARTGNIGDGKIFVAPVEQIIRIRTGETGIAAI